MDWLNDGGVEQVDRPETEDEGQEVSGKVPWGHNDDRKKETDKGTKGQNQVMSRADKVQ